MADILNIINIPTYDTYTISVGDASTYDDPLTVIPTLTITLPSSLGTVSPAFLPEFTNIYNSTDLGLSITGQEVKLPDGIYIITYSVGNPVTSTIEKTIMRVDQLQEKFDEAFMQLDMMECDKALKTQSKNDLMSIYFFIQATIAAANNCATVQAEKLYAKANSMLDNFISNDCGCSGNNFIINF